jgi:lipopolysaccharide/colanic/teichoic acid biosynthesis glycosyltransferase
MTTASCPPVPVPVPVADAVAGRWARLRARLRRGALLARLHSFAFVGPQMRRAVDIVVGGGALVVASPVLLATAAAIRLESPGPVIFRQVRVGRHGRPIVIRKLRSMYLDAEARRTALESQNEARGGVTFKIRRDPRITRVGRIIRKLSIDELPQLWNLVEGSMTLLGPRPPLPSEVARYGTRQRRRLEITPGLTCFWQVGGRSDLSFEEQVELDIQYVDRATLRDDLVVLLKTIPAVLFGKGAY